MTGLFQTLFTASTFSLFGPAHAEPVQAETSYYVTLAGIDTLSIERVVRTPFQPAIPSPRLHPELSTHAREASRARIRWRANITVLRPRDGLRFQIDEYAGDDGLPVQVTFRAESAKKPAGSSPESAFDFFFSGDSIFVKQVTPDRPGLALATAGRPRYPYLTGSAGLVELITRAKRLPVEIFELVSGRSSRPQISWAKDRSSVLIRLAAARLVVQLDRNRRVVRIDDQGQHTRRVRGPLDPDAPR